ncbi:MAG: peptidoglycan-binding protein [Pseudomonadota bacterium]
METVAMKFSISSLGLPAVLAAPLATSFAALLTGATALGTTPAEAAACGEPYTVVRGDSLSVIAQRAYGDANNYQIIYSANAAAIGPNPALISVGMALAIPCLDAPQEPSSADADAIRPVETTAQLPEPDARQIRVVVGTDWAPFTNEDQAQGGMITEIVNVALASADAKPDYKIDFINDWGAHLQPLISDHAYDFSLAWFRPNCDVVDRLGDGSKFRCNNLAWSEPLFEQLFGFYTRVDQPLPANYDDLMGTRICRPSGYAIFQLEEEGLVPPNVELDRPSSPAECFTGLAEGRYDVVALAVDTAEGAMVETGTRDLVRKNEAMDKVLTMHAVISNTHPRVDEYLAVLDNGIANIKGSQEWFAIVRRHLAEHRALTN